MSGAGGPTVVVDDETGTAPETARWAALAAFALRAEGVAHGELGLLFVEPGTIAELKATHLDGDGEPTDVLAFPLDPDPDEPGPTLVGDVVVCVEVASAQAAENRGCRPSHDGSLDAELALLVVHGVLHVCGWDHDGDEATVAMQARESDLLATWLAGDQAATR